MITDQFKSGNYNKWEKFSNVILPSKNQLIRHALIPLIEDTLISMLGNRANLEKESINISQECDKDLLKALICKITYFVEDFKVPEAPKKAIEADQLSITKALNVKEAKLLEVNIDVSTGMLTIVYRLDLFEE